MKLASPIFLALIALLTPATVFGETVDVSIDTVSLSGMSGDLAFDFIAGGSSFRTVTVSHFSSDGTLGAVTPTGDVIGTVPGSMVFNKYRNGFAFDSIISVARDQTDSPPSPGGFADGFSFYLLDPADSFPLLTTSDPAGAVAPFDPGSDSSMDVYSSMDETTAVRTIISIPGPDTLPLCALNLCGLAFRKRRQRRVHPLLKYVAAGIAASLLSAAQAQVPGPGAYAVSQPIYQYSSQGGVAYGGFFRATTLTGADSGCASRALPSVYEPPAAGAQAGLPVTNCGGSTLILDGAHYNAIAKDQDLSGFATADPTFTMSATTTELANLENVLAAANITQATEGAIAQAQVTYYQQNLPAGGVSGNVLTLSIPAFALVATDPNGNGGSASLVGVCIWSDGAQDCASWTPNSPGRASNTLTVSVEIGASERYTILVTARTINETPNSMANVGTGAKTLTLADKFNTVDAFNDPNANTTVREELSTGEKAGYESPNGGPVSGWYETPGNNFNKLVAPNDNVGFTVADDLNDSGTVVGWFQQNIDGVTNSHGFLFNNGSYTTYDFNGAESTQIVGINDKGDFVGNFTSSGQPDQGFLQLASAWHPPATFAIPNATQTLANGVNSSDVVVGRWVDSNGVSHGFVTTAGNQSPFLFDFPSATNTFPYSITDAGAISGQFIDSAGIVHGFVGPPAGLVQYDLAGVLQTGSYELNNQGMVAGHYLDTGGIGIGFTAQLCDPDISSQFKIATGAFKLNQSTDEFTQQIVLKNTSAQPISGPLLIVFKNLPDAVIMDNGNQLSVCAAPGAPYLTVNPPGGSLLPGQSVQATANFANYSNGAITYTPAVLSGAGGTIP